MNDCEHFRPLLSGYIDGELSHEETTRINQHLTRCAECRSEYETLREDATRLDLLSFKEPQDEALEKFWQMPYHGLARNAALILVVGGYVLLLFYGFYNFLSDDEEWFLGKFALSGILIGGLIIFGIALIERVLASKSDPYKEIER